MEELAESVDVIFTATPQGFLAGVLTEDILSLSLIHICIVGRKNGGKGMATAGIVMSIITIVLAVINAIAGVYLQTSNVLNQL